MTLEVNKRACPQNHRCPIVSVCPTGAITQHGFSAPRIDAASCRECGKCVRSCPMGAVYEF